MPLSVIGAGFPRTGTLSLKLALEALGVGRCHHMSEFYASPNQWPLWTQAVAGGAVDWNEVFDGYGAATDVPACAFHPELAAAFPDAKIIVTMRDSAKWLASAQATILSPKHQGDIAKSPVAALVWQMTARLAGHLKAAGMPCDAAMLADTAALFNAYPEFVRRSMGAERVLVYDVADGWAPLCAFLGVPIPKNPFPSVNARSEFSRTILVPVGA